MTEVFYKTDNKWIRFTVTDGCPTGRIYDFWLPDNIDLTLDSIVDYLNSQITYIYEKKINCNELKFKLLKEPNKNDKNYGYAYLDKWEASEFHFTKN